MPPIKASDVLRDIEFFRNNIFTRASLFKAESAHRKMGNDKVFNELHNVSTAEIERLIDRILSMPGGYSAVRQHLETVNPKLLAFLVARIQHAVHCLEDQGDKILELDIPPRAAVKWVLFDLWNLSPPAPER